MSTTPIGRWLLVPLAVLGLALGAAVVSASGPWVATDETPPYGGDASAYPVWMNGPGWGMHGPGYGVYGPGWGMTGPGYGVYGADVNDTAVGAYGPGVGMHAPGYGAFGPGPWC